MVGARGVDRRLSRPTGVRGLGLVLGTRERRLPGDGGERQSARGYGF